MHLKGSSWTSDSPVSELGSDRCMSTSTASVENIGNLVKDNVRKPVMFPGEGGSKVFIFYRIKVTTQFYETISTAYHKS